MRAPVCAYIALGANLGDSGATLTLAMQAIAAIEGVELVRRSALYRTAPFQSNGPDYVNAVVEIRTILTAPALLAKLQHLEQTAGRERPYRNAPRTLDLDQVAASGDPTVVQPRRQAGADTRFSRVARLDRCGHDAFSFFVEALRLERPFPGGSSVPSSASVAACPVSCRNTSSSVGRFIPTS